PLRDGGHDLVDPLVADRAAAGDLPGAVRPEGLDPVGAHPLALPEVLGEDEVVDAPRAAEVELEDRARAAARRDGLPEAAGHLVAQLAEALAVGPGDASAVVRSDVQEQVRSAADRAVVDHEEVLERLQAPFIAAAPEPTLVDRHVAL